MDAKIVTIRFKLRSASNFQSRSISTQMVQLITLAGTLMMSRYRSPNRFVIAKPHVWSFLAERGYGITDEMTDEPIIGGVMFIVTELPRKALFWKTTLEMPGDLLAVPAY